MIEASYTPGPWGVEQTSCSNWIGRMRPDGTKIDYIVAHTDRDSLRDDVLVRNDANARLIAAAPEMLAAIQGAMRIVSLWNGREVPEDHEHYEENKALFVMQEKFLEVIAKAEGK